MSKVYVGGIISRGLAVVSTLVLIRSLDVADYARYTAFFGVLSVAPGLVGNGINVALVRFAAEYYSRNDDRPLTLYSVGYLFETALYGLCLVLLMGFSKPVSVVLFGDADFQASTQYGLVAGVGALWLQAGCSVYQAEERFNVYVVATWFEKLLVAIALALFFLTGTLSFRNAALSVVSVNLVVGAVVTFDVLRSVDWEHLRASLKREESLLRDFFASSKWLVAYVAVLTVLGQTGVPLLFHLSTEEQVALYGVAFRYYSMVLLLLGSVHAVLLPRFSKEDMADTERQKGFIRRWFRYCVWVVVPLAAFAFLGKPLFVWVNGVRYAGAFRVLVVLLFGAWLSLTFSPMVNVLMARRDFRFLMSLGMLAFVVSLLGSYALIPAWGAIGAAAATVLAHNVVLQVSIVWRVWRQ